MSGINFNDTSLKPLTSAPSGGVSSIKWYDIIPQPSGYVLPVSQARAYYTSVLYNATPLFYDGTALRKYVSYYGGAASAQCYAAFSDDGIAWNNEQLVTGITNLGYHGISIVVAGIIHYFYWDNTLIYTPAAIRHATFNPAVSCVAATSDSPLSGNYVTGVVGNLRYGTYGAFQVFYNASPTNNVANPYSYQWCMIHDGSDGSNEGSLFATSSDGLNFSAWNALVEVIPRGSSPAWDQWVGNVNTWIDSNGLWHAFYAGGLGTSGGEDTNFGGGLGYATSVDGITWVKYPFNPIMKKTDSLKSWKRMYNPWVLKDGSGYKLYFTTKSNAGVYTTCYGTFAGWV